MLSSHCGFPWRVNFARPRHDSVMAGLPLKTVTSFGSVTELSESESSDKAVEERDVLGKKRRRRAQKPRGLTPRERLVDVKLCRNLVARRCQGKCKQNCLARFSRTALFSRFIDFRKKWKDLHKLDQDRLELCHAVRTFSIKLSTGFSFGFCFKIQALDAVT